jgi:Ca2+-binding RTX toxin-like protein
LTNNDDAFDKPIQKYGTDDIDYLRGNNGADRLYGKGEMDDIRGGRGDDRLYGEQDDDVLYGDDGNDWLYGGYDDDLLNGGAGNDRLYGEAGDDTLEGGTGNDYLDGGTGADTMIGGAGNDTYFVDDVNDVIDDRGLSTDEDTVIVMATITYKLAATVEDAELTNTAGAASLTGNNLSNDLEGNDSKNTLDGGSGNDMLDGAAGNDVLLGGEGTDILIGGDGNDTVDGGNGDDLIIGGNGAGNDKYIGGKGIDTVKYTSATASITVDLLKGTATSTAGRDAANIGTDTLSGIENVIAGKYNDIVKGNTGANVLTGGLGSDSLYGGRDKVRDVFDFNSMAESKVGKARDKVYDFVKGRDDLDLKTIDANTKVKGDQAFKFSGTKAAANSVWYASKDVDGSSKTKDIIVYGDVNGDRKADFEIGLVGVTSLTSADFVL